MSIVEAKLSSRGSTQSLHVSDFVFCLHAPSIGCGPDVCGIRTSYVSRQCTSSNGDDAAPCLLRRLATPEWLLLAF
ncbi:hypothetical protein Tco_0301192 [Tanacetum coccineum]